MTPSAETGKRISRKQIIITFTGLLVFSVLVYLPELFFSLNFNRADVKKKIDAYFKDRLLQVSYDGVAAGFYTGVKLINFRISAEDDFSRGRYLLRADSISLASPFTFKYSKPENLTVESGIWRVYINDYEENALVMKQLTNWFLKSREKLSIDLDTSTLYIHFEGRGYAKDIWQIQNIDGHILNKADHLIMNLTYHDTEWGKAALHYKSEECNKKRCDLVGGSIGWQGKGLSLKFIRLFYPELEILSGNVKGQMAVKSPQADVSVASFSADIEVSDLQIRREQQPFIQIDNGLFRLKGQSTTDETDIEGEGKLSGYSWQLKLKQKKKSALPESFIFSVVPGDDQRQKLNLPYGSELTGLDKLKIDLKKGSRNRGDLTARLQINNGIFLPGRYDIPVKINNVDIQINKNKLESITQIEYLKSDMQVQLSGDFTPVASSYRETNTPLFRGFDSDPVPIMVFNSDLNGRVNSSTLILSDLNPLIAYIYEKYTLEIIYGFQKNWLPSRIRDREWFHRYIRYLDFKTALNINLLYYSKTGKMALNGETGTRGESFYFDISDKDGTNSFNFVYSYTGNLPYISGKAELSLDSQPVLPPIIMQDALVKKYKTVKIDYDFKSLGEWPVDIYLYYTSRGDYTYTEAIPVEELRPEGVSEVWNTLSFSARRKSDTGYISGIRAENGNVIMTGSGRWYEENTRRSYRFRTDLRVRD